MSRSSRIRNYTTAILLVVLAIVTGFALRNQFCDQNEITQEQSRLRDLTLARQKVEVGFQEKRRESRTKVSPAPNVTNSSTKAPQPAVGEMPEFAAKWRKDPELLNLKLGAERAKLTNLFAPLFVRLKLAPETQSKLIDRKMRAEEEKLDLDAAIAEGRLTYSDHSVGALQNQIRTEYEADIAALLGKEAYSTFREFERALPIRESVAALLGTAALHDVSFTAEQADAIVNIAAKSVALPESIGLVFPTSVHWDQVHRQAQSFLSPSQLNALTHLEPMTSLMSVSGPSFGRFTQTVNEGLARDRKNAEPSPKG